MQMPIFFSRPFELSHESRDQVNHEQDAHQVTTWHDGYLPVASLRSPKDKKAFKISILNQIEPLLNLCQGADKNNQHGETQADNREFERSDEMPELLHDLLK